MRRIVAIQCFLLILLLGCAKKAVRHDWIAPIVEFNADTLLVCADPAEPGCAVPSPFDELMRKTSETSSKGNQLHYANLLNIGDEALLIHIHLIRAAQKSIYIQQFIWAPDESGKYIFQELVKAARRGVKVKIVSDQLFSVRNAKLMASGVLAHENLKIKLYNPTYSELETSHMQIATAGITNLSGINQRMHSKLLVVDEKIGILGGRNHQNMYFDRDPVYTFKDRDILVIGPVVGDMVQSFHEYWNYEFSVFGQYLNDVGAVLKTGDYELFQLDETLGRTFPEIETNASNYQHIQRVFVDKAFRVEGQVEFFADAPGKPEEGDEGAAWSTLAGIKSIISEVTSSLVVQTPYLIFTKDALRNLKKLRRMHPDLEIIAVTNSLASADHFFTYAVAMKQKKKLLKNLGFKIFELKPVPGDVHQIIGRYDQLVQEAKALRATEEMETSAETEGKQEQEDTRMPVKTQGPVVGIHAKSLVIDDRIALVGSHNFDPCSANFDTQLAVAIWDEKVARALKADILRDTEPQNSWVVAKQQQVPVISYFSGIIESISRALPIFDVWPFKYSSSFALKEGEEPVPPDNPEFYERYQNVGQFPEMDSPKKGIQTRLFSTMGGFAAPLM